MLKHHSELVVDRPDALGLSTCRAEARGPTLTAEDSARTPEGSGTFASTISLSSKERRLDISIGLQVRVFVSVYSADTLLDRFSA